MTQSNNALCTSFHIQGGPKRSQEMRPTISTKSLTKISFFFEKIEPGSSYLVKALWLHGNFCEATSFKKKKCYFCNRSCASRSEKFAHDGFQYNHLCLRKQLCQNKNNRNLKNKWHCLNDVVEITGVALFLAPPCIQRDVGVCGMIQYWLFHPNLLGFLRKHVK